jgi:hypothetical protein
VEGGGSRVDPTYQPSQENSSRTATTASVSSGPRAAEEEEGPVYDPSVDLVEMTRRGEPTIKSEPDSGANTPSTFRLSEDGIKEESASRAPLEGEEDDSLELASGLRPPRCVHQPWLVVGATTSKEWPCSINTGQGGTFKVETRDAQTFRVTQIDKDGKGLIGDVRHWYPYWAGRGAPNLWKVALGSS